MWINFVQFAFTYRNLIYEKKTNRNNQFEQKLIFWNTTGMDLPERVLLRPTPYTTPYTPTIRMHIILFATLLCCNGHPTTASKCISHLVPDYLLALAFTFGTLTQKVLHCIISKINNFIAYWISYAYLSWLQMAAFSVWPIMIMMNKVVTLKLYADCSFVSMFGD